MPVESLPWSIQGQSHPATVARNAQAGLLGVPAAAVSPAVQILTAGGGHGVVSAGDLAVTQNGTPNMSVNVAAGRAFIRGTETGSLNQGAYSFFNDGAVNLAVAAADPTNPRRDLVIAQVRDSNYSGGVNDARLTVVTGTPAASPSDPTPPVNALVLARIAVAAGATSVVTANITDLRTRAAGLGGVQVCTSTTRPSGASLFNGLSIYETDTFRELLYDGTGWTIMSEPVQAYTPTLGDLTLGNGSLAGEYHRSDGYVDFYARINFGSTTTIGAAPRIGLPVAYSSGQEIEMLNVLYFNGNRFYGKTGATLGNAALLLVDNAGGAYVQATALAAAVPFSWASGNSAIVSGRYRMTTRYS